MLLAAFTLVIINFNRSDIIYGIIGFILLLNMNYNFSRITIWVLFYYLMVCYYIKCRIKSLNIYLEKIESKKLFHKKLSLTKIYLMHNQLCLDIEIHNKFWKHIYFILCYSFIPMINFLLNLLLFYGVNNNSIIVFVVYLIISLSSLLALNLVTSDVNIQITYTYKTLNQFYIWLKSSSNITHTIKVNFAINI